MSQKNSPQNSRHSVSAIVIAKNEEARLAACLESLAWSDEIIVVDNASTDKTADIARKAGARVVNYSGGNFSSLRNAGMKAAGGDWLLYVDADETVTPQLAKEITAAVRDAPRPYVIKRETYYLGKKWPTQDQHVRLFPKAMLSGWKGKLHESPTVRGATGTLTSPLIHDTHRTLAEMIAKTNEWSAIEAKLRFDAGHPKVVPWRLARVMATAFFDSYVRQGGWRAGTVGVIESMYQAFSMAITYMKLWELQNA